MIRSFRHKGIREFFQTGSIAGIQASHAGRLRLQLSRLDSARVPQDMNLPGWKFHQLHGDLDGHYGATVNKNWRLTFAFSNGHASLVDYQDYH